MSIYYYTRDRGNVNTTPTGAKYYYSNLYTNLRACSYSTATSIDPNLNNTYLDLEANLERLGRTLRRTDPGIPEVTGEIPQVTGETPQVTG